MLSYFEYDEKNSLRDFGALILRSSVRNPPRKKILLATVPYNNYPLQFDLSEIYGESFFEPRVIEYSMRLISFAHDSQELHHRYSMLCNWLLCSAEKKLYDSEYPETYFIAKCTAITGMSKSTNNSGDFTVTFAADPFRRTPDYADIPWDNFLFENDCLNHNEIYLDPDHAPNNIDIKNVYSFANYDIHPRCRFYTNSDNEAIEIIVNGERLNNIYVKDSRLFTPDGFVLKPGRNRLVAQGGGKLVINIWEEKI